LKKVAQKMRATSVIIKELPKINNHRVGENSPNLVTLPGAIQRSLKVTWTGSEFRFEPRQSFLWPPSP
jgi:hypothetical protein